MIKKNTAPKKQSIRESRKAEMLKKNPLERRMRKNERMSIRRELRNETLKVEAAVVVADKGVVEDLERLIPTFMRFMPEHVHLYLAGDETTITRAVAIVTELGVGKRLHCRHWLTPESMAEAESRLSNLVNQADYWKPGPIWWKLEALRRVCKEVDGGVLLLDSDIVLTADFEEMEFQDVDAVLSPFYWSDPEFPSLSHGKNSELVPIANRDGHINAGFALVGRPDLVAFWIQMYELGIGDFYEQWCMKYLVNEFYCGYFSYLHNFGSWRRERPPRNCRSVHVHAETSVDRDWHKEIQKMANEAVKESREFFIRK